MTRRVLRIVFFGTAEFAVPSLVGLVEAGHQVLAVVTQPERPQGRGRRLAPSPVKRAAMQRDLNVLQPRRVRSERFVSTVRALAPDVLALAAFGQVIPQALLDIPPLGPINVHGSMLPKYRGAAPIQRAIMAGETEAGVTTMWMDASLDTGDILMTAPVSVAPEDTSGTLLPRLAERGAALLLETLDRHAEGRIERHPQDHARATLAPAIMPEDGYLDWTEPAERLGNRIRGVNPKPGAVTALRERRLKVGRAGAAAASDPLAVPGTVLAVEKGAGGILVAAGQSSALRLADIQPENGRRMSASEWARGAHVAPGDCFTPVVFTAAG